jgi:hypothetical protein
MVVRSPKSRLPLAPSLPTWRVPALMVLAPLFRVRQTFTERNQKKSTWDNIRGYCPTSAYPLTNPDQLGVSLSESSDEAPVKE